ncbi:MAG: hypothetical protein ACRDPY_23035 [Streptosporangiaceae bacterium]
MRRSVVQGAVVAAFVTATAACSGGASTTSTGTAATTTTAPTSATAVATAAGGQPENAAAATAAARQYFGFYSAGDFAATWGLLAPSARREIGEATWVGVHQGCPASVKVSYSVKGAKLAGGMAAVTVAQAEGKTSLGSVTEAFSYSAGRWGFVPEDTSLYGHGSVKADISAAKAEGYCAG